MNWHTYVWLVACLGLLPQGQNDNPRQKDEQSIQGTWKCIYSETGGFGFKPKNDMRVKFEKNIMLSYSASIFDIFETPARSSFQIDPKKTPKTIDFTTLENPLIPESKGTKIYCIYRLDKDRLTIVWPIAGFPTCRPKQFATKDNDGYTLDAYQRVGP